MALVQWNPSRIVVSVSKQEMRLFVGSELVATYPVSTAAKGIGNEEGSYQTPTGRFQILEKIGAAAELGTVFRSRKPCARWHLGEESDDDLVLTRILWLDGLEPSNANTHQRYIYIHGTNQEDQIGQAVSHGCVRMNNEDVRDLFERVPTGTEVIIEA